MAGTPLVGRTLGELAVREGCGVNVVGVLERGDFRAWAPELTTTPRKVLVMAGWVVGDAADLDVLERSRAAGRGGAAGDHP
ncbi:MAG TPA: TrkA C-terminal domain-containing protein [Acidimicrobiales bacterium]|nr:TrkA C-terminal domain-containing protein [Acidimicrobiales bacterium]